MKPKPAFHPVPWVLALVLLAAPLLSGCAAALLGAGAVGGYAIAKDMEDGQFIDDQKKGNQGWFGGK
jgi:hypothetical protein